MRSVGAGNKALLTDALASLAVDDLVGTTTTRKGG